MESLRYRQRVEHLERELQELQDSLNAEREKVQVWWILMLTISVSREGCSLCLCCQCPKMKFGKNWELLSWGCLIDK